MAGKAAFYSEIGNIKEQFEIETIYKKDDTVLFGTLNQIIKSPNKYSEFINIEYNKLVYDESKFTKKQKEWLEEMGFIASSKYYLIMNEKTKTKYDHIEGKGTYEEFVNLVNNGDFDKKYTKAYLIENIDFGAKKNEDEWSGNKVNLQINTFKSFFEGNNFALSGIYSNKPLISNNYGNIYNLKIENSFFELDQQTGAITRNNNGNIINANVNLEINGGNYIAGFALNNYGNIKNSSFKGQIIAATGIGGIAVRNLGRIENCENNGYMETVRGTYIGGIVSINNEEGIISECKNTRENAFGGGYYGYGGIAGENKGTIEKCYNYKNQFFSTHHNGGIAGSNNGTIKYSGNIGNLTSSQFFLAGISGTNSGEISYCYNIGDIKSEVYGCSGITNVNYENAVINNCYNTGKTENDTKSYGIIGINNGIVDNCYYIDNGRDYDYGVKKSQEDMKKQEFVDLLNNSKSIFIIDSEHKNKGYPIFNW